MEPGTWFCCSKCVKSFQDRSSLDSHECPGSRAFECPECKKLFKTRTFFAMHYERKHTKSHQCSKCAKTFISEIGLENHMSSAHSENQRIKCQLCEKTFKLKTSLERHLKRIHYRNPLERNFFLVWRKSFSTENDLDKHKQSHGNDGGFQVNKSPVIFKKLGRLKRRLADDHHVTSPFPSYICDSRFATKYEVKEHMSQHQSDFRPFSCYKCKGKFKYKYNLREHMMRHFEIKPHRCTIREKGYLAEQHSKKKTHEKCRTTHKKSHDKEKQFFECDEGGKTFKERSNIDEHAKSHVLTPQHPCPRCGSRFIDNDENKLNLHRELCKDYTAVTKDDSLLQQPHLTINESDISLVCPTTLADRYSLSERSSSSNIEVEHHIADPPRDGKSFERDECSQNVETNLELEDHKKRNFEDIPYACTNCGRRFTKQYDLDVHRMSPCSIKDFTCLCGKLLPYTNISQIYYHILSHWKYCQCRICGISFFNEVDQNIHELCCGRSEDSSNDGVQ